MNHKHKFTVPLDLLKSPELLASLAHAISPFKAALGLLDNDDDLPMTNGSEDGDAAMDNGEELKPPPEDGNAQMDLGTYYGNSTYVSSSLVVEFALLQLLIKMRTPVYAYQ